jgi:AraC-like DNA-binding protein
MSFDKIIKDNEGFTDFIPLSVGWEICKPGHKFGPHVRDYFLIHFVLNGKGILKDKFGLHKIKKGELFIIRPEEVTVYQADNESPWEYCWICFRGNFASLFDTQKSVYNCPQSLLEKIKEYAQYESASAFICSSFLHELAFNLFSNNLEKGDLASEIRHYVDINYMKEIKVEEISKQFGFDRTYLFKKFKQKYGCSIKEYIVNVRMKSAKNLLEKGYSVSSTAFMVGYNDEFNFSKAFKKCFSISPSNLKNTN